MADLKASEHNVRSDLKACGGSDQTTVRLLVNRIAASGATAGKRPGARDIDMRARASRGGALASAARLSMSATAKLNIERYHRGRNRTALRWRWVAVGNALRNRRARRGVGRATDGAGWASLVKRAGEPGEI